ncbi:MAG: MFS transporter [Austwickia sp.]|nr:MFS transporter [Austwickia sp.]
MSRPHPEQPPPAAPEVTSPMQGGYAAITLTLVAFVSMVAFEAMSVTVVMTPVAAALGAPQLYGLAFSLMFTAQMLGTIVAGPWIRRRGPVDSLFVGQALFAAGSLLAGAATSYSMLLLGRLLAGLGAGLAVVAEYVIIGAVFPGRLRPKVFGWTSAAWVLPSIVGPLIAGALMQWLSWRAVFLVVVPTTAATMLAFWMQRHRLPRRPTAADGAPPSTARADRQIVRIGCTLAVSAGAFQWGASHLSPPTWWALALAVGGLVGLTATLPRLVPSGTFTMKVGLPSVIMTRFLLLAAFNGALSFVPTLLIALRGLSVNAAGAILALTSVGWAAGSIVQGRARFLGRASWLVTTGAGCVAVGLLGCALGAWANLWAWAFIVPVSVVGLGMGLTSAATSVLTLQLSPPAEHATASSALQLSDVLGSAIGISVTGAVYAALVPRDGPAGAGVYVLMWLMAACVAALAWPAARRTHARVPRSATG